MFPAARCSSGVAQNSRLPECRSRAWSPGIPGCHDLPFLRVFCFQSKKSLKAGLGRSPNEFGAYPQRGLALSPKGSRQGCFERTLTFKTLLEKYLAALVRKGLRTCGFSRSCSIILYHTTSMKLPHYEFFSVSYNLPGRFCKKFGLLKLFAGVKGYSVGISLRCSTF